jgi:hypothetical protein
MRHFRLSSRVYLERFDADALLLVADRQLLLTVDAASAELFTEAARTFGDRPFTAQQGGDWLADGFDLSAQECRDKIRELLAFGLKYGLVCRAGEKLAKQ